MPIGDSDPPPNRSGTRRELLTSGAAFLGAFAGWPSRVGARHTATGSRPGRTARADAEGTKPLTVGTAGPLREVVSRGAGLWNANPSPTADRLVWSRLGARPEFDERLADHFASREAIASSDGPSRPPFSVATVLADREKMGEELAEGTVDVAGLAATRSEREQPASLGEQADAVARRLVARDGWAFVLSPALAEAGIDSLTPAEIRRLYSGEITTWQTLDGPDTEPYLFLGPGVTGDTNTAYEAFLSDDDTTPSALDHRAGRPADLLSTAAERDDALGVVQVSGVETARENGVPILDVIVDGERATVYDREYPLTDDVYLYTLDEPTARARAFLDLFSSPFGQETLVDSELLPVDPPAGWRAVGATAQSTSVPN